MYSNTSCTLYLASLNYAPYVIENAFLTQSAITSATKTGLGYSESAQCLFKDNKGLKFTLGKDFLCEGKSEIEVDTSNSKSLSDSIKELKDKGAYTVMRADYKGYGSNRMRHYELSCK